MRSLLAITQFILILSDLLLGSSVKASEVRLADVTSGSLLRAGDNGVYQEIPLQKTRADIEINGPIARTRLQQTFHNPGNDWLEAVYAFPLPENAAVDHMQLQIGDRLIEGQIREKQQARKLYDQAKNEGRKTALVEQYRPNLFTTSVANIPPGGHVSVQLEYQQQLVWQDHRFSLRFPMAITPRYTPADRLPATEKLAMPSISPHGWSLLPGEIPNVIPLDTPLPHPDSGNTEIRIQLDAGMPVTRLQSRYHEITQQDLGENRKQIRLTNGDTRPDKDFVLEWTPASGHQPQAAFFSEQVDDSHYGLLMLMPPEATQALPAVNRETLFIIDTSGSMGGESIRQARLSLRLAIERLTDTDTFNLIEFNTSTRVLFPRPLAATETNRRRALQEVENLEAGGGTDMLPALQAALTMEGHDLQRLQQVIFITDGAVGNEQALLTYIQQHLGQRRLFTVGIGSAPNSYFMTEAALSGRGTHTYIGNIEEVQEKMQALFSRLEKPALTQLQISSDGAIDILPGKLPDLYAGEPLNIALRMSAEQAESFGSLTLSGRLGTTEWQQTLNLTNGQAQAGLAVHWARSEIQHWMRSIVHGMDQDRVRDEVIRIALKHHLVSQYTSLVAVDVTPARPVTENLQKKALNGQLPAGSVIHGQAVRLAAGASGYPVYLIAGLLLLGLTLLRRKAHAV